MSSCDSLLRIGAPSYLKKFNKSIGSGGFGKIIKHNSKPEVVKLLYNTSACSKAKVESLYHQQVYTSIQNFINYEAKHGRDWQINVPQPLCYYDKPVTIDKTDYSCFYTMTYIKPIMGPYLHHVIFKQEYKHMIDKAVGRNYLEEVDDELNPARGFFATQNYIENNILSKLSNKIKQNIKSAHDIAYRMGLLFGLVIFDAEIIPIDVEYTLTLSADEQSIDVTILDFGMVEQAQFDTKMLLETQNHKRLDALAQSIIIISDIDLYFPYTSHDTFPDFIDGMKYALNYVTQKTSDQTILKSKKYVLDSFISQSE